MGKNLKAMFGIPAAIVLILGLMLIPVGCGSSAPEASVEVYNLQFMPAALTVSVGTTVTWKNTDDGVHSVTSDTGIFDSGLFSPGDSYTHIFTTAGTYHYRCSKQPGMTGTIFVK